MYRSFDKRLAGKAGQGYARTSSCCGSNSKGPRPISGQKTVEHSAGAGKNDTRK